MNKIRICSLGAAVFFAVFSHALADTVTVSVAQYNVNSITADIDLIGDGLTPRTYTGGLFGLQVDQDSAGRLANATTVDVGAGSLVAAFCIELGESAHTTPKTYSVMDDVATAPVSGSLTGDWLPMGTFRATAMRQLWYNNFAAVNSSVGYDSIESSAFQIALHEILFENVSGYGQWDLTTGNYQVTSIAGGNTASAVAMAQGWLDALKWNDQMAFLSVLSAPSPDAGGLLQDLLYQYQAGGEEVPEPGVFVSLAGLCLMGGIAAFRRRRRTLGS